MQNPEDKIIMFEDSIAKFAKVLSGFALINLLRSIMPFVLLPILTRVLSVEDYGILSIYESTIMILTPLMFFSTNGLLSVKYHKNTQKEISNINVNAFVMSLYSFAFVEILFIFFKNPMSSILGATDAFYLVLPLLALLRFINLYISNIWQVQQKVRLFGIFSIGTLICDLLTS
ncbi:oligosaccharide flippase family protein, partial [Candidatus Nomurabacteria bacterium]|nr:oligosaccharide flippase family protein [Candidatus Nomurabacteria bacterium]